MNDLLTLLKEYWPHIKEIYEQSGLFGVIATLIMMAGLGVLFYYAAKVNAESMKKGE